MQPTTNIKNQNYVDDLNIDTPQKTSFWEKAKKKVSHIVTPKNLLRAYNGFVTVSTVSAYVYSNYFSSTSTPISGIELFGDILLHGHYALGQHSPLSGLWDVIRVAQICDLTNRDVSTIPLIINRIDIFNHVLNIIFLNVIEYEDRQKNA